MKLINMQISEYMRALGSNAPAPGGGSAGALCGAQGAALVAMAASLTLGRKKYAEYHELCAETAESASALREQLEAQIDLDTEAYNAVMAAFKLPKETEAEISTRKAAIADATLAAAQVPLRTMELAMEAMELAAGIAGKCNVNASSDLGVAALNLMCCINSCALNVLTNLNGMEGEKKFELEDRTEDIAERTADMLEAIMGIVEQNM